MLRAFVVAGLAASTNAIRATHRTAPLSVRGGADDARATHACAAALAFFDGAGDRRIAERALHRGDDVAFVPLFGEDEGSPPTAAKATAWRSPARPAAAG